MNSRLLSQNDLEQKVDAVVCRASRRHGQMLHDTSLAGHFAYPFLLEFVKNMGDLGQHQEGEITRTYAANAAAACIELHASLARDFT